MIRSIPACAGEPYWPRAQTSVRAVYPRVCGGTIGISHLFTWEEGLSPRVRGNRAYVALRYGTQRSIPACAGEPFRTTERTSPTGVYPRVCGGTILALDQKFTEEGLSPRVRGNR